MSVVAVVVAGSQLSHGDVEYLFVDLLQEVGVEVHDMVIGVVVEVLVTVAVQRWMVPFSRRRSQFVSMSPDIHWRRDATSLEPPR